MLSVHVTATVVVIMCFGYVTWTQITDFIKQGHMNMKAYLYLNFLRSFNNKNLRQADGWVFAHPYYLTPKTECSVSQTVYTMYMYNLKTYIHHVYVKTENIYCILSTYYYYDWCWVISPYCWQVQKMLQIAPSSHALFTVDNLTFDRAA